MPRPHLLAATLCAAALLPPAPACPRTLGRYQLPDSPTAVVLHYEAFTEAVIPPKAYDLTVFADGRVTGFSLSRASLEWHLSDDELEALLASLEETGVFHLSTEAIAIAHVEAEARLEPSQLIEGSERETDRLTIRLPGRREPEGTLFAPLAVDLVYDDIVTCVRNLPDVPELVSFHDAVFLMRDLLRSGYPELLR